MNVPGAGQRISSDFSLQEFRAGLNYHFGNDATPAPSVTRRRPRRSRTTSTSTARPRSSGKAILRFRSPYAGPNSLPGSGEGRETFDATLYAGVRLWQGAEFWINPEIDQGFGLDDTHGVAGFSSAEAYKLGAAYPYARVHAPSAADHRSRRRHQKVDADVNQFAGSQTANRLVLTVGRFAVIDIFDTNKYANNPEDDFLNWSLVNAGTFDYAGDAWGYTYGAAAEWYQGRWTLARRRFRSVGNPDRRVSPLAYGLDPTSGSSRWSAKSRNATNCGDSRARSRSPDFSAAVTPELSPTPLLPLAQATGLPANINAVRSYHQPARRQPQPGTGSPDRLGVFARAGWADGNIEPWDFTDIDRTVAAGISLNGKRGAGRTTPSASPASSTASPAMHMAFLNAGGLGILIGDGKLPHYGPEKIFETYYSYALTASTDSAFDYQFVTNPGYNADRGPVNIFAGRFHTAF